MPLKETESLDVIIRSLKMLATEYQASNCPESKKWLKHVITQGFRQIEKFITPRASVAAQKKADELDIGLLKHYVWNDQEVKMKDPDRKIFHFEHVYPVGDMFRDLMKLEELSDKNIESILVKADIAWILKSENQKLDASGERSNRPENPWESYEKCNIPMLPL